MRTPVYISYGINGEHSYRVGKDDVTRIEEVTTDSRGVSKWYCDVYIGKEKIVRIFNPVVVEIANT